MKAPPWTMSSRLAQFAQLALVGLVGCSAAGAATSDDELVGGSVPASLPPGIVALHTECTAAKIGPREFLTAGHCVVRRASEMDVTTLEPSGTFASGQPMCLHPSITVTTETCVPVNIVTTKVHPSFAAHVKERGPQATDPAVIDLAVIRVDRDTPSIASAALARGALAAGSPIQMTGYGCTSRTARAEQTRTLHVGRATVAEVGQAMFFTSGASAVAGCPGDSGGPVYVSEDGGLKLTGVNSFILSNDATTAMVRVDVGSEGRRWIGGFVSDGARPASTTMPLGVGDVRLLATGGFYMPGALFHDAGIFSAFGGGAGFVVAASSADLRTFVPPQALPWRPATDVTGASVNGRHSLYFVGALGGGAGALQRSVVHGNLVDPPTTVSLAGSPVVPYWPQATALPDGRTLLAFVEPQKRAFYAIDDGSGGAFAVRPFPNVSGELRGVLAHVGTTKGGSWVLTHQTADASWRFTSFVQLSSDGGATWSAPRKIQPDDPNIHDAFPIARRDEGVDVYYLRAGPRNEFNVHRRAVAEDGTLGPEEVVTAPEIGHVEKPQPRRLPDGRIAMMFAVKRAAEAYDLALAVLDGDAPRGR